MSGWNLPPGCTTLPGEEEYPDHLECPRCRSHLCWDTMETRYLPEYGDEIIVCRNCGCESRGNPVFGEEITDDFKRLGIPEIQTLYADYEEWEDASPNGDPFLTLYNLFKQMNLKRGTPLYTALNRLWYFLKVENTNPGRFTTWVSGTGEILCQEQTIYYTRWHLNGYEIANFPTKNRL